LWVGREHLDDGRELFKKWGYKRCEDVVWIKTNKKNKDIKQSASSDKSILQRVKEHCLVGLKGDIKKASDTSFIHANIDIDVIVDEEPEPGSLKKPE
jgi:N6-adenosine-specific RNA methylase IME4